MNSPVENRRGRRGSRRSNRGNGNSIGERISREEKRELLKQKDMDRMWTENNRFTRYIGHRGF